MGTMTMIKKLIWDEEEEYNKVGYDGMVKKKGRIDDD